jgi:hypothetical protein
MLRTPESRGYKRIAQDPANENQRVPWHFEPTDKREFMSQNTMRYRIQRGFHQPVDKEPPLTQYIQAHPRNQADAIRKMFDDMADVNLPAWNDAQPEVQGLAIEKAHEWLQNVKTFHDLSVENIPNDPIENESSMLAYAFCLNALTFDRAHHAISIVYRDDPDLRFWGGGEHPEYRYINEETIHIFDDMIRHLFHEGTLEHGYTDSGEAQAFALIEWTRLVLKFEPIAQGTGHIRHAAFFPFLSGGKVRHDLSKFGIYTEFDINNYQESCFVHAYRQYLLSMGKPQEMIEADCDFLRSIMRTFSIPVDNMKFLSNILNLNMIRRVYNNHLGKLDSPKRYFKICPRFEKPFEILYRDGHYMIWEEGLNAKISAMKRLNKLIPLTAAQINEAVRARAKSDCQAKPCSLYSFAPMEVKRPYRRDLEKFFNMPELSAADRPVLAKRLSNLIGVDVEEFGSLAAFGQFLMHKAGCYQKVMGLRGVPAEFIRKCLTPIVLGTPHQKYPIKIEGSVVQYDRKSSYPHIYTSFEGIPIGEPIPLTEDKFTAMIEVSCEHNPNPQDIHFYVCVDIQSYECKHDDDPYPLLKKGLMYLDSTLFRLIMEHYDMRFRFVSGYYFKEYNTNIKILTLKLFRMKCEADPKMARVLKNLMNGMWGKAMAKGHPLREKIVSSEKVDKYCEFQGNYVYSKRQLNDKEWLLKIVVPINADFSCPQFSVNVSSYSRKIMQEMIYKAVDLKIPTYYSNTDSICLNEADADKLFEEATILHGNLGDFMREFESTTRKFICLSPKKYIHCFGPKGSSSTDGAFKDGDYKTCNGPRHGEDPEQYFERIYAYRSLTQCQD